MTLDPAEGLPVEPSLEPAANEDFTEIVIPPEAPKREAGWDPYEIWRTRVKLPSIGAWARPEQKRRP